MVLMVKPTITYDDFVRLDLRVGEVKDAEEVSVSKKLIRLKVDMGEDYGVRTIFAGLVPFGYTKSDFVGKKFVFLANLAPKSMPGGESQGMMFSADSGERAIIIPVGEEIPNGSVVR